MELFAGGGNLSKCIVELEIVPEDCGRLKIAVGLTRMDRGYATPVWRGSSDLGLRRDS